MATACATCGQAHGDLPFGYGARAPLAAEDIPAAERDERLELGSDQCVIDDARFFLRARLEIAVTDAPEHTFIWGVWVEVTELQFDRAAVLWETHDSKQPPMPGTLATAVPCLEGTAGLAAHLHFHAAGQVPRVVLAAGDHPLVLEQQQGIDLQRVKAIHDSVMA